MLITFLLSLLTGLGIGSGGLYVLYLLFFENASQKEAQGLNLLFFSLSALVAFFINLCHGKVKLSFFVLFLVFGIPGAFLGTFLASLLDKEVLRRCFGVFLILMGLLGLPKKAR